MNDPERAAIGALVTGARAGYWTLPDQLADAWEVERRVGEEQQRLAASIGETSPERVANAIADAVIEAVRDDRPTDPKLLDGIVAAEIEQRKAAGLGEIFTAARERARLGLFDAFHEQAETIVVDHLRAAHVQTLAAVRETPSDVSSLAERYSAIRRAWAGITGLDLADRFAEVANWRDLFVDVRGVDWYMGHKQTGWHPDPDDEHERLRWLASDAVEAWLPLPAEAHELWLRVRAEFLPQRQASGDGVYIPQGM